MNDTLSIGGVLCLRDELFRSLVDRARAGDMDAVAECRKLLRDQAHDIYERDMKQRQNSLFGGLIAAGKRVHADDNGNG